LNHQNPFLLVVKSSVPRTSQTSPDFPSQHHRPHLNVTQRNDTNESEISRTLTPKYSPDKCMTVGTETEKLL